MATNSDAQELEALWVKRRAAALAQNDTATAQALSDCISDLKALSGAESTLETSIQYGILFTNAKVAGGYDSPEEAKADFDEYLLGYMLLEDEIVTPIRIVSSRKQIITEVWS